MNDIVYVIGAGINQVIKNLDGVSPPLMNNFFIVESKLKILPIEDFMDTRDLFDYIQRYWKKSKTSLASINFDMEECFTFVESQLKEAQRNNDNDSYNQLARVRFNLRALVARVLTSFWSETTSSEEMKTFGKLLWKQKPTIITFNYDTFLEEVIKMASGHALDNLSDEFSQLHRGKIQEPSEELLTCHFNNWDYNLGYGVKFDEVELDFPGPPIAVSGKRFYANPKNQLYNWSILKLHGSLNWFQYLPVSVYPEYLKKELGQEAKPMEGTILTHPPIWSYGISLPDRGGWLIDPIIVPPTLFKEQYFHDPVYSKLVLPIWEKAKEALSKCNKLILIGYSFPPTDFATKRLFLEAFAENELEQLTIVNPDTSIVQRAKELCHFEGPVTVYKDLKEFVGSV